MATVESLVKKDTYRLVKDVIAAEGEEAVLEKLDLVLVLFDGQKSDGHGPVEEFGGQFG